MKSYQNFNKVQTIFLTNKVLNEIYTTSFKQSFTQQWKLKFERPHKNTIFGIS